jgi:hypothetical protein
MGATTLQAMPLDTTHDSQQRDLAASQRGLPTRGCSDTPARAAACRRVLLHRPPTPTRTEAPTARPRPQSRWARCRARASAPGSARPAGCSAAAAMHTHTHTHTHTRTHVHTHMRTHRHMRVHACAPSSPRRGGARRETMAHRGTTTTTTTTHPTQTQQKVQMCAQGGLGWRVGVGVPPQCTAVAPQQPASAVVQPVLRCRAREAAAHTSAVRPHNRARAGRETRRAPRAQTASWTR